MKRLNVEEIKQFANALSFTDSEANDITDLFFYLKRDTIVSIIETQLESVDDYIKEWEDHWHREKILQNVMNMKEIMNTMSMMKN